MDLNNTKSFKYKKFEVPIEDEMLLLSNTNKLILAVGISSKKILSIDELSRVASSLFVAIFESLFHEKIQGVIRVPKSRDDYEKNAQLVIDSLSDQIQLDLKHITGRSIVSGDIRVLSNLVHILIRIVSLTSQESLTTYDSSMYMGGNELNYNYRVLSFILVNSDSIEKLPQQYLIDHFGINKNFSNESISTRDSVLFQEQPPYLHHNSNSFHNNIFPDYMHNSFNLLSNHGNEKFMTLNEEMKNSIAKAQTYLKLEKKLEIARRRRENMNYLKESRFRAMNLKHQEIVKGISQKKWLEDSNREKKSFYLQKSNEEQVTLRKAYRGLLNEIIKWRIEEQHELKQKTQLIKEQNNYQIQSIEHLFQERLKTLAKYETKGIAVTSTINNNDNNKYEVVSMTDSVLKSLTTKYDDLMKREVSHIEQNKARELLKRRESHKNLLALLSLEDWESMLRSYNNSSSHNATTTTNAFQ